MMHFTGRKTKNRWRKHEPGKEPFFEFALPIRIGEKKPIRPI